MTQKYRKGHHTVTLLTVHIVWVTKYRYHVLKGDVQRRCRELIIQICDTEGIEILKGAISKDHVHMHIEYAPKKNISDIIKKLKGKTSRVLQMESPRLKDRYWAALEGGVIFGLGDMGLGAQET